MQAQTINFNGITLRSLPDGTRDYIEIDNVAKKAWCRPLLGQGNVSGSGAVYIYNTFADVVRFSLYLATYDGNGTANGDIISSHLPNTKDAFTSNSENIFIHPTSGSTFYISLAKSRLGITDTDTNEDKIAKCRTWLGLNNIEISYKLAEPPAPIELDYNAVKTYYPYTNIYTNATIQPMLDGSLKVIER